MAVNVYEGMFILDSNRYGRDAEAVSGQIPQMIEKAGGEILVSRLWEERRLAYAIQGHRKGTYWLTYFRLGSDRLADIERQCRLSDSILRVLFLKVDPRIVDALVAHAQAGPTSSRAAEDGETVAATRTKAVAVADKDDAKDNADDLGSNDDEKP
ncbi:MAG: 30S ribosomal protein S6 [Pirellulales bacterium]|nr:30S ribosomal protein S6 [Pirellulales bacterium]